MDVIGLDTNKAHDSISCTVLISNLDCYSLDGWTIRWVNKWMDDQAQKTEVNDSYSNWRLVTTGVAQGPVMGHLLFTIFIEESEVIRVHSYLQRTLNLEDQSVTLKDKVAFQRDLAKPTEWGNRNLTKFSEDGCEAL